MRTPSGLRTGTFDNWNVIQASLSAGSGYVYIPGASAYYSISKQLTVPKGVTLCGDRYASILSALPSFPQNTAMVRLGDGTNNVAPESRIESMGLECNAIPGSGGVYSNEIQEEGGVYGCSINDFMGEAIRFDGPSFPIPGAENFAIRDCNLQAHTGTSNPIGIHLHNIFCKHVVDNITIVTNDAASSAQPAIYCFNGWGRISNIHAERFSRTVQLVGTSAQVLDCVEGHASIQAVVEISAAGTDKIAMIKITKNGSQYSLFDSRGGWGGADYDLVFASNRKADGTY